VCLSVCLCGHSSRQMHVINSNELCLCGHCSRQMHVINSNELCLCGHCSRQMHVINSNELCLCGHCSRRMHVINSNLRNSAGAADTIHEGPVSPGSRHRGTQSSRFRPYVFAGSGGHQHEALQGNLPPSCPCSFAFARRSILLHMPNSLSLLELGGGM
jgi:hypothetical protein